MLWERSPVFCFLETSNNKFVLLLIFGLAVFFTGLKSRGNYFSVMVGCQSLGAKRGPALIFSAEGKWVPAEWVSGPLKRN